MKACRLAASRQHGQASGDPWLRNDCCHSVRMLGSTRSYVTQKKLRADFRHLTVPRRLTGTENQPEATMRDEGSTAIGRSACQAIGLGEHDDDSTTKQARKQSEVTLSRGSSPNTVTRHNVRRLFCTAFTIEHVTHTVASGVTTGKTALWDKCG